MSDDQNQAQPTDGRRRGLNWQRIGAVAGGAVALLVAVGAWVVPEPLDLVCDLTGHRPPGCNDVPGDYLGEWTGTETCHFACVRSEYQLTLTIRRGQVDAPVVTSRSSAGESALCESSWVLKRAGDDALELYVEHSRFVGAKDHPGEPVGCPSDLTVWLHRTEQSALKVEIRSGSDDGLWVPPGTLLFTATLQKQ
ncbi:hypothetical protein [Plantactinospora sp. B5E13]|uniref:hypothetical protein n=1 Tax=Plantactinospora sp. B5E13 TaxID=3153758 RepID=UPI00325E6A1F